MNPNAPMFVPVAPAHTAPASIDSTPTLPDASQPRSSQAEIRSDSGRKSRGPGEVKEKEKGRARGQRGQHDGHSRSVSESGNQARAKKPTKSNQPRNRKHSETLDHELSADAHGRVPAHLLGFKYATGPGAPNPGGSSPARRPARRTAATVPFSKERFVQANCQFVVRRDAEYTVQTAAGDPDASIDWASVRQVRVFAHKEVVCPICLGVPVAARMAKCGHVFCWPCVLHYLALGDRAWRKCPICYESIYPDALRSAAIVYRGEVEEGAVLAMHLVARAKGSTIVLPAREWEPARAALPPLHSDPNGATFCNVVCIPNIDVIKEICIPDRDQLNQALREAESHGDTSEVPYIRAALQRLDVELQHLATKVDNSMRASPPPPARAIPVALTHASDIGALALASNTTTPASDNGPAVGDNGLTVFFQAGDGQRVYLASVNARALVHEYGDMARCPGEIAAAVVQLDRLTITDETRRRYKFLAHLPIGSEAALAELNLHEYLSPATQEAFKDELAQRQAKRKAKAAKEKADARRLGRRHDTTPLVNPMDPMQFPVYTIDNDPPAVYVPDPSLLLPRPQPVFMATGPSFAQAAKAPQPHSGPPPQRAASSTSVSCMVPLGGAGRARAAGSESDDEELAAPAFSTSFSLAIQETLARTEPAAAGKKGKQKTVLFATASQRRA